MHFSDRFPENLRELLNSEWVIMAGKGAFAASTASQANTRKQHGLFVAPTSNRFKRYVYVSRVEDQLFWEGGKLDLTTSVYRDAVFPEGFKNLRDYSLFPYPRFVFEGDIATLKKSVHPLSGELSILLRYTMKSKKEGSLKVRPILGLRYLHGLSREREIPLGIRHSQNGVFYRPGEHPVPPLIILAGSGEYSGDFCWYRHFAYDVDRKKGNAYTEDLPSPGYFMFKVEEGKNDFFLLFTLEEYWSDLLIEEPPRVESTIKKALRKKPEQLSRGKLPHQFQKDFTPIEESALSLLTTINNRSFAMTGYPYHSVNVYELLLFLNDFLIRGGYVSSASSLIDFLIPYLRRGLLPKYLNEEGDPVYCAADTALLFVEQLSRYLVLAGHRGEIENKLTPIGEIVNAYLEGTDFDTKMDDDYLIRAGSEGVEATWMDRLSGGNHINRRFGKAVDVNALWYNALSIYRDLTMVIGNKKESQKITRIIPKIKSSFLAQFVLDDSGYLADVIRNGVKDPRLRPNQLFALTLTNPVIAPTYGKRMLQKIKESLVTDWGLRTLSPESEDYTGTLEGNELERLHGLFNGSILPHLALKYADASIYVHGPKSRVVNRIKRFLLTLRRAADKNVPAFLPEAFDGDPPHEGKGSPVSLAATGSVVGLFRLYDSIKTGL